MALLLTSAAATAGCTGNSGSAAVPPPPRSSPPIAQPGTPPSQPPPSGAPRAAAPSISTDTLVLTLSGLPEALQKKPLGDPAWRVWVQQRVGDDVQVMAVRALGPTQQATAASASLLISIAPTTEERVRAARSRAEQGSDVARAEVDPIWSSDAVPNDPRFGEQWQWQNIQASQAWDTATGSPNVVVAVIDTGIDLTHPELVNALWTNPNDPPDGQDNDGNGLVDDVHGWNFLNRNATLTDQTGHGTHVAGLIAAERNNGVGVAGVASGVKIMPLVVGASAPASAVLQAIYYAADHGANIINMSFGGPETVSGARAAIDYAVARGVLLVASAGNKSTDKYNYPAVYQDVLAVAATDASDRRATLSSYGRWVDIAAPGQDVLSTFPPSDYLSVSGTSQAAPIVAGVAALVKSVHPDWSVEQIRAQLLATADELSATNPDYVGLLGAGRVNAARAVGPAVNSPRAYLAGVTVAERTGDGDQQLGAGESGTVSVSLHFTAGGPAAAVTLSSADPAVTVIGGAVTLAPPRADRTQVAQFQVSVASNVAKDRVVNLTLALTSAAPTATFAVPLAVAPSYRRLVLPFSYRQNLLPHSGSKLLFVADDAGPDLARHRVYAAFRNADGTFSREVVLSDTTQNARKPHAVVDANGDVHVAFYQSVQSLEFASFPSYAKYTAATDTWATTLLTGGDEMVSNIDAYVAGEANNIALGRGYDGALQMAFGGRGKLVILKQSGGVWTPFVTFPFSDPAGTRLQLDLAFATVDGGLRLFVHPIATRTTVGGPAPDTTRPVQMLAFDGSTWSEPVALDGGTATENAQMPFVVNDNVHRYFQPNNSTTVLLGQLTNLAWGAPRTVQDIGAASFRSSFGGLERVDGALGTLLARPVAATSGSTRELRLGEQLTLLAGDTTRRAMFPVIHDVGGIIHAFVQERRLERDHDDWSESPDYTSYYTQGPLSPAALPTTPVVVDDGATTSDGGHLHARWSSTHAVGIASYRVAWGTAPGKDDLVPWTPTTASELTIDLQEQRLLPGQTAYASVQARSSAVLSSAVGVSDGITVADTTPCTAPLWNATAAYQEAGALVTYEGATYRSRYWNSGSVPTNEYGAWERVASCTGTPPLPSCTQPKWTASQVYPAGSRVSHNGMEFVAQWASETVPTGAAGNPWQYVLSCRP